MFNLAETFHLTCGALKLYGNENIEEAKALLRECSQTIKGMLRGSPDTSILVKGVEYMNDDPRSMDVLYASASLSDGSTVLQDIADHLHAEFTKAGFLEPEHDHVKLHATVINSKKRSVGRQAFSARLF